MKKIALCTFLSLSTAFAAQGGIKYEIEPIIGYNNFDSASKMKNAFIYGVRGTVYLDNYYGYRLSYERADDVHYNKSTTFSEKMTDLQRISGQILVNGDEEFNVIPYLLFGGGYEILSQETNFDVSQGYVEGGVGFKYHAYNNINVNLEAKALKKFDTDDIDTVIQFGFGYFFDPAISNNHRGFMPTIFNSKKNRKDRELPTLEVLEDLEPIQEGIHQTVQVIPPSNVQATYVFEEESASTQRTVCDNSAEVVSQYNEVEYNNVSQSVAIDDNMYYIQMAAWFKDENPKLLNRLAKTSHPFEVVDTVRKNRDVKVVVVGPFADLKEAKRAYRGLKKIKRDAFITKLN